MAAIKKERLTKEQLAELELKHGRIGHVVGFDGEWEVVYRKPTPAELADCEWWGHEYGIDADTAGVIDRSQEFKAAIKTALPETI